MARREISAFDTPLILFGAFDRHNFGDLLLCEVTKALANPSPVVFAGLAERDLSAYGGERVRALDGLAREWGDRPAVILHVGGELLTCSLYEAAVMLQSDDGARVAIATHDGDPQAGYRWAAGELGLDRAIAYQVLRGQFRNAGFIGYLGVGGVALGRLPEPTRRAVVAELRASDHVWVRDRVTHRALADVGVPADLAPDPAEMAADLFADAIGSRGKAGEPAAMRERFPQGYVAVQFSADFGDDATLAVIVRELQEIRRRYGFGIVLFRAGSAPWHDRLDVYRRLLGHAPQLDAAVFESLHIWDIGALLAQNRGFAGSSLHARIVAEAFGRPAASLVRADGRDSCPGKVQAYVESWSPHAFDTLAAPGNLAVAFSRAVERQEEVVSLARHRQRLAAEAATACLFRLRHRMGASG